MTDIDKVLTGLECLITNEPPCDEGCPYYGSWHCLKNVAKDARELLKEQQEERERIVRWLSKFCIHIDQYPNGIKCSDAERYVFFRNKMHQQFGW